MWALHTNASLMVFPVLHFKCFSISVMLRTSVSKGVWWESKTWLIQPFGNDIQIIIKATYLASRSALSDAKGACLLLRDTHSSWHYGWPCCVHHCSNTAQNNCWKKGFNQDLLLIAEKMPSEKPRLLLTVSLYLNGMSCYWPDNNRAASKCI